MKICTNGVFTSKKRLWIVSSLCFFITIRSAEPKREFITMAAMIEKQKKKADVPVFSQKTFKIFDTRKMVKDGVNWNEFAPGDLLLVPDNRGCLITMPGEVRYINFGTLFECDPHRLHVHGCKGYTPMVAAAQNGDTLWVVSACNCKKGEPPAEYIVSKNTLVKSPSNKSHRSAFSETLSKREDFQFPIQALQLSNTGRILAIATQTAVHIINLETEEIIRSNFVPRVENVLLIDIAIKHPHLSHLASVEQIAALESEGRIDIKNISDQVGNLGMGHLKTLVTEEVDIKRIHFFDSGNLLFVTDEGFAKIIEAVNWLEYIENSKGGVTARTFSYDPKYNKVDVDQSSELATVHWSDNNQVKDKNRTIKIHREDGAMTEKFILEVNPNYSEKGDNKDNKYSYITAQGKVARAINHWVGSALRKRTVVALSTDGTLQLWTLPDKSPIPSESDARMGSDRFALASKRLSTSSPELTIEFLKKKAEKQKTEKEKEKAEKEKAKRRSLLSFGDKKEKVDKSREHSREQSPAPKRTSSKRKELERDKKEKDETDSHSPQKEHHPREQSSLSLIVSVGDLEGSPEKTINGDEYEQIRPDSSRRGRGDRDSLSLRKKRES